MAVRFQRLQKYLLQSQELRQHSAVPSRTATISVCTPEKRILWPREETAKVRSNVCNNPASLCVKRCLAATHCPATVRSDSQPTAAGDCGRACTLLRSHTASLLVSGRHPCSARCPTTSVGATRPQIVRYCSFRTCVTLECVLGARRRLDRAARAGRSASGNASLAQSNC